MLTNSLRACVPINAKPLFCLQRIFFYEIRTLFTFANELLACVRTY
nr:MAG TPA: hypothetical protein [Caudoviricetes sp.]